MAKDQGKKLEQLRKDVRKAQERLANEQGRLANDKAHADRELARRQQKIDECQENLDEAKKALAEAEGTAPTVATAETPAQSALFTPEQLPEETGDGKDGQSESESGDETTG